MPHIEPNGLNGLQGLSGAPNSSRQIPISREAADYIRAVLHPSQPTPNATATEMAWNECKRKLLADLFARLV